MQVKSLKLRGVTKHEASTLEFPETGLICVEGPNGAGKSSATIEGVATALYGKTLRGKATWDIAKPQSSIELVTHTGLQVMRGFKKGKTSLTIAGDPEYETTTKAQEALEARIPSFALWKRASVLSSQDGDNFAELPAAERTRLLESVIGLEKVDRAHSLALADCKICDAAVGVEARQLDVLETSLKGAMQRKADAERVRGSRFEITPVDMKALKAKREDLGRLVAEKTQQLHGLGEKKFALQEQNGTYSDQLEEIAARGICPLCHHGLSDQDKCGLVSDLQGKLAQGTKVYSGIVDDIKALKKQHDAVNAEYLEISETYTQAAIDRKAMERWDASVQAAQGNLDKAEADILRLQAEIQESRTKLAALKTNLEALTHVVKLLGTKGIRTHILGKSLGALQALSQQWLNKLSYSNLQVRLSSTREKATGGTVDEITLEVDGAGGGHGYAASSGGERRRINTALMLGLAQLSEAHTGSSGGTLFVDECFDALDNDGVEAVCAVLQELRIMRCVVVITHNSNLAKKMRADQYWHVVNGRIAVRAQAAQAYMD